MDPRLGRRARADAADVPISWSEFWNANIFHPDPLALALSEHLFGQTLQILPVYWLTGNIILCYNLLFISTFALSAFGTYLLVLRSDRRQARRLHRRTGLRLPAVPHRLRSARAGDELAVDAVRAVWHQPIRHHRVDRAALAGGTAALVMQNWSCGYYLLYFAPFVPLFAVHRMWTVGTLRRSAHLGRSPGCGAVARSR